MKPPRLYCANRNSNSNNSNNSNNNKHRRDGSGHCHAATISIQSKLSPLTLPHLGVNGSKETLAPIQSVIRKTQSLLNELLVAESVDQAVVHAVHYEQAMTYHKLVGPPEAFYDKAMSFSVTCWR